MARLERVWVSTVASLLLVSTAVRFLGRLRAAPGVVTFGRFLFLTSVWVASLPLAGIAVFALYERLRRRTPHGR